VCGAFNIECVPCCESKFKIVYVLVSFQVSNFQFVSFFLSCLFVKLCGYQVKFFVLFATVLLFGREISKLKSDNVLKESAVPAPSLPESGSTHHLDQHPVSPYWLR
jgi:hypothetical protein